MVVSLINGIKFYQMIITGTSRRDFLGGWVDDDVIYGLGGDDYLGGQAGNDSLYGGFGIDDISGGDGNDRLWGEDGSDKLRGGNGSDILDGGSGNDLLLGGFGSDTLTGGTGADSFNFSYSVVRSGPANADLITDFNPSQGDKIRIEDNFGRLIITSALLANGRTRYTLDAGWGKFATIMVANGSTFSPTRDILWVSPFTSSDFIDSYQP